MNDVRVVLKFGAWDPFHIGHLNVLRIAANLGDFLVVGVMTDARIREAKGADPVFSFHDRVAIISSLRMVDIVIPTTGLGDHQKIAEMFGVDIVVIDEAWGGVVSLENQRRADTRKSLESLGVKYVSVPRTPGISSSSIKESIKWAR